LAHSILAHRTWTAPTSSFPLYHFNGYIKTAEQCNMVIGTLAVDGWAVTFGTARRGLGGLRPRLVPSSPYQIYQPTHQWPVYQL